MPELLSFRFNTSFNNIKKILSFIFVHVLLASNKGKKLYGFNSML